MLGFSTEQEFREVVSVQRILEALGVVRPDGTVSYSVAVEILKLAANNEYLKQLILRFTVDNFREDLRKMLGISYADVRFAWG